MRKSGLSLLEIMISVLILAITLASLANVFVSGKRYILHARSRIRAAEMGKFFLEPLQMQVNQGAWATNPLGQASGTPLSAGPGFTLDTIPYSGNYTISSVPNNTALRKVVLTVSWTENAPIP